MEDALALIKISSNIKTSLNPCCNGRCTRTAMKKNQKTQVEKS